MSPTLLELVVALLLLYVAWEIATWIGPRLLASFISFWRKPDPYVDAGHSPDEKNITPPDAIPPQKHDPIRK